MSEVPEWAMQFMPLNAAEKAAEIKLNEELKQMQEKIESLLHAECNNRIAVQQERIATLEGMLAENKRVLRLAMGTVARLQWQPITPESMPRMGDEVKRPSESAAVQKRHNPEVLAVTENMRKLFNGPELWHEQGWTHFRPINPPMIAARATPPAPQDTEKDAG